MDQPSCSVENASSHPSPAAIVRYGVGFDVHKDTIVACVKAQLVDATIIEIRTHTFNAHPAGLNEICHFLQKYHPISYFLMECTGVYHLSLFYALKQAFPQASSQIVAMNPLMVNHRLAEFGNKHDKADARGLATLTFYDGLVKPSYIGDRAFMELRDLTRAYARNRQQTSRIKNQITRIFHANNIKFAFDFATTWVREFLAVFVNQSLSFGEAFEFYVNDLREHQESTGVAENNRKALLPFVDVRLQDMARYHLSLLLERLHYEEVLGAALIVQVEQKILAAPDFAEAYRQLLQITGFGSISALTVLTEIGDYRRFTSWNQLAKYAGVVPQIGNSAEVKHKGHINRYSNGILRHVLCQIATILINRADRSTDLGRYADLQFHVKQKPFKVAMIKVGQKLIRVIFEVLVGNVPYSPSYEREIRHNQVLQRRFELKRSYLESSRIKVLRSDISRFLVNHYEDLNAKGRFHLAQGFHTILNKAKRRENSSSSPGGNKKRNYISKGGSSDPPS